MEFWGVEVKPGETVKCDPGEDKYLHLSQASLGETEGKETEDVQIFVKFDDQKLVLGTLSAERCPQYSYDLVFEKEFKLSHNSKSSSVYFCGYKSFNEGIDADFSDSDDDFEVIQMEDDAMSKGKRDALLKPEKQKASKNIKTEQMKDENQEVDDDDDGSDSEDDEGDDDNEDAEDDNEDDDDDDDEEIQGGSDYNEDVTSEEENDSEEEDEAKPVKVETSKKRPAQFAPASTVPEKKPKLSTSKGGQRKGLTTHIGRQAHSKAKHVGAK